MSAPSFVQTSAESEATRLAIAQAGSLGAVARRYLAQEAELAALQTQVQRMAGQLADAKVAAGRWEIARRHLTRVYQLYTRDDRHDGDKKLRYDVGEIADQAADRVQMGLGTR